MAGLRPTQEVDPTELGDSPNMTEFLGQSGDPWSTTICNCCNNVRITHAPAACRVSFSITRAPEEVQLGWGVRAGLIKLGFTVWEEGCKL